MKSVIQLGLDDVSVSAEVYPQLTLKQCYGLEKLP